MKARVEGVVSGLEEPYRLGGSMTAQQECVWNHTHCVHLGKLVTGTWDEVLRKIDCMHSVCIPITEQYISDNGCQYSCGVFRT